MSLAKSFEKRIQQDLNIQSQTCIKIPEEYRLVRGKQKPIQVKTCFDFACAIKGRAVFFDAKTCERPTFNLNTYVFRDKKIHQWNALKSAFENGSKAGYLIWFYNESVILWAPVDLIQNMLTAGEPSIRYDDVRFPTQYDYSPLNLEELCELGATGHG